MAVGQASVKRGGYAMTASTNVAAAGFSPADSTSYYCPLGIGAGWLTSSGVFKPAVPKTGIIRNYVVRVLVGAQNGSGESVTYKLLVNGSIVATLSSAITWNPGINTYTAAAVFTGLAAAVTAGDYVELEVDTPAWATNPTGCFLHHSAWIEE
jgi:hypothetical protein